MNLMGWTPASDSSSRSRTSATRLGALRVSTVRGSSPSRPSTTAMSEACPTPVAPSDP